MPTLKVLSKVTPIVAVKQGTKMFAVGPIKTFINRGTLTKPKWEFLFSSSPAEYRKLSMSDATISKELHDRIINGMEASLDIVYAENRGLRQELQKIKFDMEALKENIKGVEEQAEAAKDLYERMRDTKDQALGEVQILRGQLNSKIKIAVSGDTQRIEELEKDVEHWKRIATIKDGTIQVLKEWVQALKDRQKHPHIKPVEASIQELPFGWKISSPLIDQLIKFVEENLPGGKGDSITVENVMDRLKEIFTHLHHELATACRDRANLMEEKMGWCPKTLQHQPLNEPSGFKAYYNNHLMAELKMVSEARDQYQAVLLSVLNGVELTIEDITREFIAPSRVPTLFNLACLQQQLKAVIDTIDARQAKQELSNLRQIAKAHAES
jgi:hypothetical protein